MGATSFQVTVTAADKATATIRKINEAIAKTTRPFEEVGKEFKTLGRGLGIDKIGKNLQKMGVHARDAAKYIGDIATPLAGLSGIASVAGIIHLADSWANLGRSITYTAQNIGISTTQLQTFQNAAKLAGISSDAATQSLATLGKTMEDAVWGRNQQALILFDKFTGGVKRTKGGAMDITAEFKAMAKAIYDLPNAQQQNLLAAQVGLTAWLPMIRQGPAAMARELAVGATYDMTPAQLKSADEFAQALSKMSLSAKVLGYNVGNALIPALKPMITELSTWVDKNRDLISNDVGDWVRNFASWVKTIDWKRAGGDIHTFIKDIDKTVNALGGLKGVLIDIAGIKVFGWAAGLSLKILQLKALTKALRAAKLASEAGAAGDAAAAAGGGAADAVGGGILARIGTWAAGILGSGAAAATAGIATLLYSKPLGGRRRADGTYEDELSNDQIAANAKAGRAQFNYRRAEAMRYFMSPEGGGWSRAQAAGIVGNLIQESTLRPNATNGNAAGLAQWMGGRAKLFQQIEGVPLAGASYAKQLDFVNWELHHTEGKAGRALAETNNPANAAMAFGILDERFGNDGSLTKRMGYAREAYDASAAVGPYTAKAAAAAPAVVAGKLHLDVHVNSTGTTVKATPGANTTAGIRVSHSTVGDNA